MSLHVRYKYYLDFPQEGIVIATIPRNEDPENPYLLIQDIKDEHNYHDFNGTPYAEIRRSEECEFYYED